MARWRQSQSLPGVAIDLGPISAIVYVPNSSKVAERLRKAGDFSMLDEDIVLQALNAAVLHSVDARSQIIIGLNSTPCLHWDVNGRPQLDHDARFTPLWPHSKASARRAEGESTGDWLAAQLAKATDR